MALQPIPPTRSENDQAAIDFWNKRFDKRHISSNPLIATLDVEYNELVLTWKTFQENLLPEDQVEFQQRPQECRDVLAIVRSVQAVWMSSSRQRVFRRSMALCDQFVTTMDSHSVLLKTLPKNETCLSLFYAVLQSIIKACANYPKIMEGLITALIRVNESFRLPVGQDTLSLSRDSILSVARLYARIFFLLGELMDWYMGRAKCRLLKSPSQDLYFDFQNLVSNIRSSARGVLHDLFDGTCPDDQGFGEQSEMKQQNELYLWGEARLSQVGLQRWDRRFASQTAMTRQLIWEIQHDAAERFRVRNERDLLLSKTLDSASQSLRSVGQQNTGIACLTTAATRDLDASRFKWSNGPKRKYTRVQVQLASGHLQGFFNSDDQVADFESDGEVVAEDSVMASLQQWATNSHSQALAVKGSPSTAFLSPVALISACYSSFARQTPLPVISHFCSLPDKSTERLTSSEHGLIALAYSLIRQLIDYLPPVFECHDACDLSAERFLPLNGTLSSWEEVLSLIDILLYYAPPLLICVIDGLDVIQDSSTDSYIRSLVRTFLMHTRQTDRLPDGSESQPVLLKVLFTVARQSDSLVETLSENQLLVSEPNQVDEPSATDPTPFSDMGVVMMNA